MSTAGWRRTRLSRAVVIRSGRDFAAVKDTHGKFPVFGSGGEFARATEYLYNGHGVIFGRKGTIDRPTPVGGKFWVTDTGYFVEPMPGLLDARFFSYWSLRFPFMYYATDTALPSMTRSDIGSEPIDLPPHAMQVAIADYLDQETAEIDALISEQQDALNLLSSRWESELVRCVQTGVNTKAHATGLDTWPHAPQAWRRTRLKATTISTRNGAWGTEPGTDETTVRCIRVADFDKIHGSIHDMNTTSRSYANAVVAESSLQPGDLILEKSGGGPTTPVGNVVRYTGPGDEMYSNFVARIKVAHEVDSAYALRLHQALYASGITTRSIKQTTGIQNLDSSSYFNEPIFLPPQTEQQRIAEYLQHRRHDIDELGADLTRAITLARERRAALITAAVTGQIDVTAKHRPSAEQLEDDIKELT